jgi:hypothetical protein
MVRRTVTGNACVSATREERVATGSVPVLWSTLGDPHFPSSPLPLPVEERRGERGVVGAKESSLTQWSHEYGTCPMRNLVFLIRL